MATREQTARSTGTRAPTTSTQGYAARSATTPLAPFTFERRATGPRDVRMDILFCGVCHSDLHTCRDEWAGTTYPVVPGHEIVGRVTEVGKDVTGSPRATWRPWAAWWTPAGPAPTAGPAWSSIAR
jgi:Zn-dependent alcohol dehydrogenases